MGQIPRSTERKYVLVFLYNTAQSSSDRFPSRHSDYSIITAPMMCFRDHWMIGHNFRNNLTRPDSTVEMRNMLNKKSFMIAVNLPFRLSKERLNVLAQTCTVQRLLLSMLLPLPLLILFHSQMSSGPRFCAVNNRRMSEQARDCC